MQILKFSFKVALAIVIVGSFFASNVSADSSDTINTKSAENCSLKLGWTQYMGKPRPFYGAWDGTYTVFLFKRGQTRDQFVDRERTTATQVEINNLDPNQQYDAEVFVTGAFLEGKTPYWQGFSFKECTPRTVIVTNSKNTTVLASNTSNETQVSTLPDTGWEVWSIPLISLILIGVGGLITLKKKPVDKKHLQIVK